MTELNANDILAAITDLGNRMDKRFEAVEAQLEVIKTAQAVTNARLDGFEKRLDDQGRFLAALIPTRITAVPPAAE